MEFVHGIIRIVSKSVNPDIYLPRVNTARVLKTHTGTRAEPSSLRQTRTYRGQDTVSDSGGPPAAPVRRGSSDSNDSGGSKPNDTLRSSSRSSKANDSIRSSGTLRRGSHGKQRRVMFLERVSRSNSYNSSMGDSSLLGGSSSSSGDSDSSDSDQELRGGRGRARGGRWQDMGGRGKEVRSVP